MKEDPDPMLLFEAVSWLIVLVLAMLALLYLINLMIGG